jgi:hypothetical protein
LQRLGDAAQAAKASESKRGSTRATARASVATYRFE